MLSIDAALPRFLEKGKAALITQPVFEHGSQVEVTSATYSLFDSIGGAVVSAGAATVPAGVPTYALAATFADAHQLPQHPWRERWELVVGGVTHTIERDVQLCRVLPVPFLSLDSLYAIHPEWREWVPRAFPPGTQSPITTAWEEMVSRLLGDQVIPSRILNWRALSIVHKYWTAAIVARAFAADIGGDSRWERRADAYEKRASSEYDHNVKLAKDSNEDGVADSPGKLESPEPLLVLQDLPAPYWRY